MCVLPHSAEGNSAETHHRSHRKVDSARDENRCKCERKQTDFCAETNALEEIVQRKEIPARDAEQDDLERDQDPKHNLLSAVRFHREAMRTPSAVLSSCRSHRLEQQLR